MPPGLAYPIARPRSTTEARGRVPVRVDRGAQEAGLGSSGHFFGCCTRAAVWEAPRACYRAHSARPRAPAHVDEQDFLRRADLCLERVAAWLEDFDPDEVDFATADGVVTLEFGDGQRFVLNRQAAADQMWFAAGARAWHYDFDAASEAWVDDRDGHDLYQNVALQVSEKLGRTVEL